MSYVRIKFITRLAYGDALPKDEDGNGEYEVFGSNGAYSNIDYPNTHAPVIIVGRKGSYGKMNWSPKACFASDTTFYIDSTCTKYNLRWLYYVLQTLELDKGSSEAAVPGLNRDFVYEKRVLLPPLEKQEELAEYIDSELTTVDKLINIKQNQLQLLTEKRQTLITQAITKGIDTRVILKDSGSEWFGKVPKHWNVIQLKYLSKTPLQYGANEAALEEDLSNPRFVRITDIDEKGNLRPETFKSLSYELAAPYILEYGDILFARSGATVGKSFLYQDSWGIACFAGYLIKMSCNQDKISPEYLSYITQSNYYWSQVNSGMIQATIQNFNGEKYGSMKILLPPLLEQKNIIEFLNKESILIESVRVETLTSINLLNEKKQSVITEAVNGQIEISA